MFIPQSVVFDVEQALNNSLIFSEDADAPSSTFYPALLFVIFLIVFYGMALWDRWINLRTRELYNRPIYCRSHARYGSVSIISISRTVKDNGFNVAQNGNSPETSVAKTDTEIT